MATYTLKRKLYANGERSNTGAKLLAGGAALAGGFAAAKHGMLGNSLAKGANKAWASAGKTLGSGKMIESGAKGYGEAAANQFKADFTKRYGAEKAAKLTEDQMARQSTKYANKIRTANGTKAEALPKTAAEKKKLIEETKKKGQEEAKKQAQDQAKKSAENMSAEELNATRKAEREAKDAAYKADQERQAKAQAERQAKQGSQRKPAADPTKGMTDAQKAVYNEAMAAGNFNRVEAIKYARQFSHSGSIMSFLWK